MSLKLKTILTTAMLLTSLAVSALPNAPVSAVSAEAVSAGKAIAKANGIVLDSDADAAELAVLNELNGGVLPKIDFAEDGTVSHIDGLISGMTVRTKRDAKAVIASLADLLGIQDADTELSFSKSETGEFDTCFIFQQMYKGVRVANASVAVFADAKTSHADYLNSSFVLSRPGADDCQRTVRNRSNGRARTVDRLCRGRYIQARICSNRCRS